MKIESEDRESGIDIELMQPGDPHSPFALRLFLVAGTQKFSGANESVHFIGTERFLADLSALFNGQGAEAFLEGTEECWLRFFRWNQSGHVGLRTRVSRVVSHASRSFWFSVEGEFKLSSERQLEVEGALIQMLGGKF